VGSWRQYTMCTAIAKDPAVAGKLPNACSTQWNSYNGNEYKVRHSRSLPNWIQHVCLLCRVPFYEGKSSQTFKYRGTKLQKSPRRQKDMRPDNKI